ncbi:MAG: sulfotransferase domain-containing protein, partial [Desulfamplus sp.]|nr:sulfotransferase domain-containing protein [Desulfamplus sp.]
HFKKAIFAPLNLTANTLFSASDALNDFARYLNYFKVANLEFKPRADDIFIVTYPRSGTTWLQMILYQLATDGNMEIDHIAQKVPWFERLIDYRIWNAKDFEAMDSPRLFKSHLSAQDVPKGNCKYIYMVRNGYDVAISYFEFYCSHLGFKGDFDQFFKKFIDGDVQFGSWFAHAADWKAMSENADSIKPSQILFLKFEDMKNDFDAQLDKIITFAGFKIPSDRLPEIRERCSFKFMKQHEDKFDHITAQIWEKGYKRSSFIREGKSGQGKARFTLDQQANFKNMLKKFHIEEL